MSTDTHVHKAALSQHHQSIPWVEKYRPTDFHDIVLDPLNKTIMTNILNTNHFPNMLLYGPPGTGKTTTIISLVNHFQEKNNQKNKGLMIHLNASDERGIDIIRNQIHQFVNSQSLFMNGMKFVILDEVDYMTKNAQQALKYLLQEYSHSVKFCLICNYISRIDESLQNEFMRLRFNQLPEKDIIHFLSIISDKENLRLSVDKLCAIQRLYKSDIRSMINYMQSNQNILLEKKVIDHDVWNDLTRLLGKPSSTEQQCVKHLEHISSHFNVEINNIIKDYLNYIIRHRASEYLTAEFLRFTEFIMHLNEPKIDYLKHYFILWLKQYFTKTNK